MPILVQVHSIAQYKIKLFCSRVKVKISMQDIWIRNYSGPTSSYIFKNKEIFKNIEFFSNGFTGVLYEWKTICI